MTPADLHARLRLIDADLARPYAPGRPPPSGGADFHLVLLTASRDFWDDRSAETVEPALAAVEAELEEVAAALTERWGAPAAIDPRPYADAAAEGAELPSAFGYLYTAVGAVRVWCPPGTGRWVALAVVQDDAELPFLLYAAVGDAPLPGAPGPAGAHPPPRRAPPPTSGPVSTAARPRPLPGL